MPTFWNAWWSAGTLCLTGDAGDGGRERRPFPLTMSVIRELYTRLPQPLMVIAVNVAGLRTLARKMVWGTCLRRLDETERWTPEAQQAYVGERLSRIMRHAIRTVPRYQGMRSTLAKLEGASPVRAFEVLEEFPVVTKEDIRADPDLFVSNVAHRRWLVASRTSGTTGSPLTTLVDPATLVLTDALSWRRTLWAGYEQGDWIARLVGDRVVPLHEREARQVAVSSRLDRRLYLSTYHLSRKTVGLYVDALRTVRPSFVMGYPSALFALCSLAGEPLATAEWRPKAVLYSSEPLLGHQRDTVESAFRAPCRGFYGSAERVFSAAECEYGTYHVSLVDGYLEGQFWPDDSSTSRALVTTLTNTSMPLIRYAIGDNVRSRGWTGCPCGRTLPTIDPVVTKAEDCVLTPSGRVVSPSILTWAFKDVDGLVASQVAQTSDSSVEIRLVCDEAHLQNIKGTLEPRLHELLFGEMTLVFVRLPRAPLTSAGKTRFVVDERQSGTSLHGRFA